MQRVEHARPSFSRSLVFGLGMAVTILGALPVCAQTESACSVSAGSRVGYGYLAMPLNQGSTGVPGLVLVRLRVLVASDGSTRVRGVIRTRDDVSSKRLRAIPSSGQAFCADADGDDASGLVRLAAVFRTAGTDELVPVMLTTPGQDIDAAGRYLVTIQIGTDNFTVETDLRIRQR